MDACPSRRLRSVLSIMKASVLHGHSCQMCRHALRCSIVAIITGGQADAEGIDLSILMCDEVNTLI